MSSQIGQDNWILQQVPQGFFVDIGAYDGVKLSNTLLLEKNGWDGVCIEPLPDAYKQLIKNRNCLCWNIALYSKSCQQLGFTSDKMDSGIIDHLSKSRLERNVPLLTVSSKTLDEILIESNAPTNITYISLDTEGSELEILKGFSFDRWNVDYWTIEHNDHLYGHSGRSDILKDFFLPRGYNYKMVKQDIWFYK